MLHAILKSLLRLIFRLAFRVRIYGNADIRAERLLIVANHESFLDELLLGLFLPQRPVIVVHASAAHNRLFRYFALGLVDYLPIDPHNPMELKSVIRLLETGQPVLIFPEGRVTTTGNLMKTYDGSGFIAAKAGASILPVRIDGAARSRFSLLKGRSSRSLFPRIRLFIQEPTRIETAKLTHSEQHDQAAQSMHRVMTGLMFAGRPEQTLFSALVEAARQHGHRRRLLSDTEHLDYSYNDLLRSALILGRKLAGRLQNDERIGILMPNTASLLALVFGLTAFRRTPVLLNPGASIESLQAACRAAKLSRVLTTQSLTEQSDLAGKLAALNGIEILQLDALRQSVTLRDHLWWLLRGRLQPLHVIPPGQPDDAALVMFTTGSANKCKGVVLSHRAILSNVSQLRSVLDFSANDVLINALPLHSPFGLTCGGLIPLLSGAQLFLYPSPQHYRLVPELSCLPPCTVLLGTNTFLSHYGTHARPFDLHGLRYVVSGAERITDAVRQLWFEKFGVRIFESYGMTETAPIISVNTQAAFRSGSVGQILPGLRHRLTPLPGIKPRHGGICGQLHVAGPNLMDGYLRSSQPGVLVPPHSAAGDGWHDTGDIIEIDADGFLYVHGRVKRVVEIQGASLGLGVLERILDEQQPDHGHAIVPIKNGATINVLRIFSTNPGLTAGTAAELFRAAGISLPDNALQVVKIDKIPRQAENNKIDYVQLKNLHFRESGHISQPQAFILT